MFHPCNSNIACMKRFSVSTRNVAKCFDLYILSTCHECRNVPNFKVSNVSPSPILWHGPRGLGPGTLMDPRLTSKRPRLRAAKQLEPKESLLVCRARAQGSVGQAHMSETIHSANSWARPLSHGALRPSLGNLHICWNDKKIVPHWNRWHFDMF